MVENDEGRYEDRYRSLMENERKKKEKQDEYSTVPHLEDEKRWAEEDAKDAKGEKEKKEGGGKNDKADEKKEKDAKPVEKKGNVQKVEK